MRKVNLVSKVEIAERLGYPLNTVQVWYKRGLLPDPLVVLAIGPVWNWATIYRFAVSTGRVKRMRS